MAENKEVQDLDIRTAVAYVYPTRLRTQLQSFQALLPSFKVYYQMWANSHPRILEEAKATVGRISCCSGNEIEAALRSGVAPADIMLVHPYKQREDILYAKQVGVTELAVSSVEELAKIKQLYPEASLLLLLRTPVTSAEGIPNVIEAGADLAQAQDLLRAIASQGLKLKGITLNLGFEVTSAEAFARAINVADTAAAYARNNGLSVQVLNIGGGLVQAGNNEEIAETIRKTLRQSRNLEGVELRAEAGKYVTEKCMDMLVTCMAAVPTRNRLGEIVQYTYALSDGFFGCLKNVAWDNYKFNPKVYYRRPRQSVAMYSSVIWGPTGSHRDLLQKDRVFPELEEGDVLFFSNIGHLTYDRRMSFHGIRSKYEVVEGADSVDVKAIMQKNLDDFFPVK